MSTSKKALFALVALGLFFGLAEAGLWLAGVEPLFAARDPFQR